MKDYYKSLEIEKGAPKEDIKKAFHKLAHKYHPDKKGGDSERFKEISEAYSVLSDDQKRKEYDTYGRTASGGAPGGGAGFEGFSGAGGGWDFSGGFGDFGDINDIFSDFFGGGMGGRAQNKKRGRDISTEIGISFEESIFGVEKRISINKMSTCDICQGSGGKPGTKMKTCTYCHGQGKVREIKKSFLGSFTNVKTCEECSGSGQIPEEKCHECRGAGVLKKQQDVTIIIPAGINNGETVRITGMGEAVARGTTGDLYIKINVARHTVFKREGDNLLMNLDLKLSEALLGAEHIIRTLDGEVKIKIPEGATFGEVLKVREKGVPGARGKRGDLLITLNIKVPNKLSKKSKELINELQKEGI